MDKDEKREERHDKEDGKICLTGPEMVSIAGSIAICLSEKYGKEDLKKLKILFSAITANISVVEHDKKW
ncbi:MAG: hypothetical protein HFI85_06160 [Clostridia bacterium]|jgi:hypothetical protein|nr:hypothetical protein [Clostridia bacterium]